MITSNRPKMNWLPAVMLALFVAGCTGAADISEPVTTSTRAPIGLAVNELRIVSEAPEPPTGTFKDKRNSARLVDSTRDFLGNRVRAGGGEGWAQMTITQAEIIERPLATTAGLKGLLLQEADAEFDADLGVRIAVMDGQGLERAFVEAKVGRTRPLSESLDVLGRTAEAEILIGDLLRQLDDQLTQAVDAELGEFKSF